MGSPFCCRDNTKLIFEVPVSLEESDDANFEIKTRQIRVSVFLEIPDEARATKVYRLAGLDDNALLLEGFCVSPMVLPKAIAPGAYADCDFGGSIGKFYLMPPINPPYGRKGIGLEVERRAGTKIIGWFQPGGVR